MINRKILILVFFVFGFFLFGRDVSAHQPRIIYEKSGEIEITDAEISRAFFDELKESPRDYFINSDKDFNLYINLLVPFPENKNSRYSADVFLITNSSEDKIASIDGLMHEWRQYYEEFGRDYYLKGPEFEQVLTAGRYKIEVFSPEGNKGKYVLAVGKTEQYDIKSLLNIYWQLPLLKVQFFKSSPLQFFLTPFGIAGIGAMGAVLIFLSIVYYLAEAIREALRRRSAKTMLLTSAGMQMKEEIKKLLQKPAYDITVAFITTAAKPMENLDYLWNDWTIMKEEMRFNIEEIDIEGKSEAQVMNLLKLKDIIFVEGGNTFYLLNAMRKCNFEKIIRKLLKQGKVYIGVSAGSIVAGRTIKTAGWKSGDKNIVGLKNLKGLNLVPFDIFVHYRPEHANIIKQQIKNPKKRKKHLRILTDEQAILVQGKEAMLIGRGKQVLV